MMILLLVILLAFFQEAISQIYTLRSVQPPVKCVGGSPCLFQPSVAVIDPTGAVDVTFVGSVYALMENSPTGFESLYVGECDTTSCGTQVFGTTASAKVVNGVAVFSGLMIRTVGTGYTLRYIGRNAQNVDFAYTISPAFDVLLGPVYKTAFQQFVGTSTGGEAFLPNPIIVAVDRGENPITDINNKFCTAFLSVSPTGKEVLKPEKLLRVQFFAGVATFQQLYLNESGSPYQVSFSTDLDINGFILRSNEFEVQVGEPAKLSFENGTEMHTVPVLAGEFFSVTPRVNILDVGGNLVESDSSSAIVASLNDNPSNAVLGLADSLFTVANRGKATFSTLVLDKIGRGFRMKFTVYQYDALRNLFMATNIALLSEKFDVVYGPPRRITSVVYGSNAWAGGQPFKVQPKLSLLDYGGNILADDFSSVLTASLLPSLGTQFQIKVDTTGFAQLNTITSVTVDLTSNNYGAGQDVVIYLHFAYEMYIDSTLATGLPYIQMLLSTTGVDGRAVLASDSATSKTLVLKFIYPIAPGDSVAALDYVDQNSFVLLGNKLYDGIARVYTFITLPPKATGGISLGTTIQVDTSVPVITSVVTGTADGEYGAGELIVFNVTFNLPVVVTGVPALELTSTERANYTATDSTGLVLTFEYNVGINAPATADLGFSSDLINLQGYATIKRQSPTPTTDVDLNFTALATAFLSSHAISIDTSQPILDVSYGVTTDHASGTYYPGEEILLYVKFTKQVAIKGISISLFVDTGRGFADTALINGINSDLQTVEFLYTATTNMDIANFDIYSTDALSFVGDGNNYIRRLSTNPLTNVDQNTTSLYASANTLRTTKSIAIRSTTPVISSVSINSVTQQDTSGVNLYPDDTVLIDVVFSTPIYTLCNPVLNMDVSTVTQDSAVREAVFVGGNNSNTLQFLYTVQIGDSNTQLAYRFTPNAFCLASGCPAVAPCQLLASSTSPQLAAQYVTPIVGGTITGGQPISGGAKAFVIQPLPRGRNTTVVSVIATLSDTEIGSGQFVQFKVTFSDEVTFAGGYSNITLYLSVGKFAQFAGGTGTKVLTFSYITENNDATSDLVAAQMLGSTHVFNCEIANLCHMVNMEGQDVDLTTSLGVNVISTNLVVNTDVPYITDVWSDKVTSVYDGFYSVGESFYITVRFSKPVLIAAKAPELRMSLGAGPTDLARLAIYEADLSNSTDLVFFLQLIQGDHSEDLTYDGADAFFYWSKLYRVATVQVTEVDYTMPMPAMPVARNGHVLRIETRNVPTVLSVETFNTPAGSYSAGDRVFLKMTYSQYVIMDGSSFLAMRLGDHTRQANYIGTESTFDTSLYKEPSKTFYFKYIVETGDFNHLLDYVDVFSFRMGVNEVKDVTTVLRVSSVPTQIASRDLPMPGTAGSLSAPGSPDIYVNGATPYVTSFKFLKQPSVSIGVNYKVDMAMKFNMPVTVTGSPYVLMETGTHDREGYYYNGSGTDTIIFRYVVQPGDESAALDYYADRATSGSALTSFVLNGGTILATSYTPTTPAFVRLNPIGGVVSGTLAKEAVAGQFQYLDLTIPTRGPDYFVRFSSSPPAAFTTVTTTQDIFVSFSNEFKLAPGASQKSHRVGHDVDIDGDIAVVGSPRANMSVTTIQLVTTHTTEFVDPVQAVQIFAIVLAPAPAIIEFHTTADIGETISGSFSIQFGTWGETLQIPVDANGDTMKSIIERDATRVGIVTVERTPYIYCACNNAFTWKITFTEIEAGPMFDTVFDYSAMTTDNGNYDGLMVSGLVVVQEPAYLTGTFTLASNLTNRVSSDIPYNADLNEIAAAIHEIGLIAVDVKVSQTQPDRSRIWEVTFGAYDYSNEIPDLILDDSNLFGSQITSYVQTTVVGKHGPTGLNGEFTLEFRGNTTARIPYNVSAVAMKEALEALDTITYVNVQRSFPSSLNTYTWTVEFVDTNTNSPRGYTRDLPGNVEAMVATDYLIGTKTEVLVTSLYNFNDQNRIYEGTRRGSYGDSAGRVYVYQQTSEQGWDEVSTVIGNNTNEHDEFGHAVAVSGNYLLVGAPHADNVGVFARQSIYCNATSGYFKIKFRGWTSAEIPYDVQRQDLIRLIIASKVTLDQSLVPIQGVKIESWIDPQSSFDASHPGLCANHTALITFLSPTYGAPVLNAGVDVGPDMELLVLDTTYLGNMNTTGVATVRSEQRGTIKPDGPNADSQEQGSAYLFEAIFNCLPTDPICVKNVWQQQAQFFPEEPMTGFERFGYSVAVTAHDVIIGSPGSNYEEGRVYVYTKGADGLFSLLQVARFLFGAPGDNFGHSVAIQDDTLIIGAPYANNNSGAVYSYKRVTTGSSFIYDQTLTPPAGEISIGDMYGWSVALEDNTLVIGSIRHDSANTIYFGTVPPSNEREKLQDTGAVYTFQRKHALIGFLFLEKLVPTNVRQGDQFGYSVDIHSKTIVVGAVEHADEQSLLPSVPIMRIKSSATYNMVHIGSSFKLQWLARNMTELQRRRTSTPLGPQAQRTDPFEAPPLPNDGGQGMGLRTTRSIAFDVTASVLEKILEEDLYTGDIVVTRSRVDVYDGGYEWQITFANYLGDGELVPLMSADTSSLSGTNVQITIDFVSPTPPNLRGLTHVFQQEGLNEIGNFKEQLFLTPFSYQPTDRCGYSVAIYGDYALVGCPNRDGSVPNTNAGTGIIYYMSLLSLQFPSKAIAVQENAGSRDIEIARHHNFSTDVFYFLTTVDRNAIPSVQTFLQQLYGVGDISSYAPKTVADIIEICGTALAKSQYYGSTHNESKWMDGIFDYRGIADYVPLLMPLAMLHENQNMSTSMVINPDTILETPNENVSLALYSPGIYPSPLGRLHAVLTIEDSVDGEVDVASTDAPVEVYAKLYKQDSLPGDRMGEVIALDTTLKVMVVGCPYTAARGVQEAGEVVIYRRNSVGEKWEQLMVLQSPNVTYPIEYVSHAPTSMPSGQPTSMPTASPINQIPTGEPTGQPTSYPTGQPSGQPTRIPTSEPSSYPTSTPTSKPINIYPTGEPTSQPSSQPSGAPTSSPTSAPSTVVQGQPIPPPHTAYNHFGDSVVVNHVYDRGIGFIAIGEPKTNSVHIYKSTNDTGMLGVVWEYEKLIKTPDATLPQHRFGERGSVAMDGFTMVIGAPGLETIYIYFYQYSIPLNRFDWTFIKSMVSSEYDFDIIVGIPHVHRQEFGKSVAISGRTVAVGAPFADYDKLGSPFVEIDYSTEGTSIFTTGRGRAYIFDSMEAVQTITLFAVSELHSGDFKLQYDSQGVNAKTTNISYSTTADELKTELELLENIDSVTVTKTTENNGIDGYLFAWTITFNVEMQTVPELVALYGSNLCAECNTFDKDITLTVAMVRNVEPLVEYQKVYAKDRRAGDRFGYTIALDAQQLLVGAPYSAAVTSTTWDFEIGTLEGWSITGTAFSLQPTYGDNSNFRLGYDIKRTPKTSTVGISTNRESSNVVGTYYVGTYEAHPGNSSDYTVANSTYRTGNTQGDGPVGTMISQVFTIRGTMISFLLGGGCNMVLIYVSLIIDGMEVSRVTGDCTDYMERRYFEVTPYFGRSAQLKVVDDSSSNWGHINVDDFKFNWEVVGSVVNGTADTTNRVVYGGMVETPQAGAAYAFRRHVINSKDNCVFIDHASCVWEEESKLMASDKRPYAHFGSSLAVNDAAGVLAVGAPHASLTGFFKESLTVYPYQSYSTVDISGVTFPVRANRYDTTNPLPYLPQYGRGVSFPISMARDDLFVNLPSYAFQISAAKAMAFLDIIEDLDHNPVYSTKTGAVYVFRKEHSQEALGTITVAPHWPFTEHAKIHTPDATPFDFFGTSVALDGRYLMASATGQDGVAPTSGAVYAFDAAFASVKFSKPQYVAIEATDNFLVLTVLRDLEIFSGELSLEYATSDLSAIGVDAIKFASCLKLPTNQRSPAGCGHYQQTHGIMTIPAGITSGVFTINIMNDLCRQKYFRYLQVTLAVPGSSALQGEVLMTRVRIDDDDFLRAACAVTS